MPKPTEPEVTVDKKAGTLTIVMPLRDEPQESKSGKTMVIATTSGNHRSSAKYDGHSVTIGVNAFYKNPNA